MQLSHLTLLALVQGITEFLPISSSAHLQLVPFLGGWPDQGPHIDIAVHVGTLAAVVCYFLGDIGRMIGGTLRAVGGKANAGSHLTLLVVIGSLPVVAAGLVVYTADPTFLRSIDVIIATTIGFGLLLWVADRSSLSVRRIEHMTVTDALIIGMAQILALIPGTSRSGITMTAARFLGIERQDAARFSMLLSIPAILGAGTLLTLHILETGDAALGRDALVAGAMAFVAALVAIAFLMRWLRTAGFGIFVLYRLVLGGLLIYLVYY